MIQHGYIHVHAMDLLHISIHMVKYCPYRVKDSYCGDVVLACPPVSNPLHRFPVVTQQLERLIQVQWTLGYIALDGCLPTDRQNCSSKFVSAPCVLIIMWISFGASQGDSL